MSKTMAEYSRERRKRFVDLGKCGYCGWLRLKLKWLCDECAILHRERQRKAKDKNR